MLHAAKKYYERGWLAIPLGLDQDHRPKRPLVPGWPRLERKWDIIADLPWKGAQGLGIVLGEASSGLAAIDVDDEELARWLFDHLTEQGLFCRMVWTIRHRIHIFCQEQVSSPSRKFKVRWQGREIEIELKATGNQVATVPTPGYEIACDAEPAPCTSIIAAWTPLAMRAGIETLSRAEGNYPQAWQDQVVRGDRNKAAYVEAHRLREARVPIDQAIDIMQVRWERAYEAGGAAWREIERTVRSAYSKGLPPGQAVYELWSR